MDLNIKITDENGYLLEDINVYQDGSDSKGAADIAAIIGEKFKASPLGEVCHNCEAICPNWPKCDECGVTHTVEVAAGRCSFCGEQECPHDIGEVADVDLDNWDWISIRDRFDTLSDVLDIPPPDHAALAEELRSMANWIQSHVQECDNENFDTGKCVLLRSHSGECLDDCGKVIE